MRPLPHGQFLGDLNRSVQAGGFSVDLRVATLPPEAVTEHSHDTAHFILPLADGYRSLARDPLAPVRTLFGAGSAIYNPPGGRSRPSPMTSCSPPCRSRARNGSSRPWAWRRAAAA